jgi:hypothetical protein
MEIVQRENIDYEINLRFINGIREKIQNDVLTHGVQVRPRDEDFSQYIVEEEDNVLLSVSNV